MEPDLSPQAARILTCAQGLIAAGGYNGFSYADIARRVGITKATIHHHFPRKADLVRSLVQRYRFAAARGLDAMSAEISDPLARLEAFTAWLSSCVVDGTTPICVCAMLGAEVPSLPPEVSWEVRLHFAHLVAWVEKAITEGHANQRLHLQSSTAAEAQAFTATVHGAMLFARACDNPVLFGVAVQATMRRLIADPAVPS